MRGVAQAIILTFLLCAVSARVNVTAPTEWFFLQTENGLALTLSLPKGKQLVVDTLTGGDDQLWGWSDGRLMNKEKNFNADVARSNRRDGAKVIAWQPCRPGHNQHWELRRDSIYSTLNGKVMQVSGLENGSVVEMETPADRENMTALGLQRWIAVPVNSTGVPLDYYCSEDTKACGPANSECIDNRCMCGKGSVRDPSNWAMCVKQSMLALGAYCDTLAEPCGAIGSECRDWSCTCKSTHMQNGARCMQVTTTVAEIFSTSPASK